MSEKFRLKRRRSPRLRDLLDPVRSVLCGQREEKGGWVPGPKTRQGPRYEPLRPSSLNTFTVCTTEFFWPSPASYIGYRRYVVPVSFDGSVGASSHPSRRLPRFSYKQTPFFSCVHGPLRVSIHWCTVGCVCPENSGTVPRWGSGDSSS